MKRINTNPYLKDRKKYYKALAINVSSSTAIEKEIANMTYIVCNHHKSKPRKPIEVCEQCKKNKKCKDYQEYLTQREKEVQQMATENKSMPMFPVDSNNIVNIGYNANNKTLRIEFKGNSFYDYTNVPPETFSGLMASPSKGKFFYATIKGKFDFSKVAVGVTEES